MHSIDCSSWPAQGIAPKFRLTLIDRRGYTQCCPAKCFHWQIAIAHFIAMLYQICKICYRALEYPKHSKLHHFVKDCFRYQIKFSITDPALQIVFLRFVLECTCNWETDFSCYWEKAVTRHCNILNSLNCKMIQVRCMIKCSIDLSDYVCM